MTRVAVDGEHQLIVSTHVTANASDQGQMIAQLKAVKATYGQQPEIVIADTNYRMKVSRFRATLSWTRRSWKRTWGKATRRS